MPIGPARMSLMEHLGELRMRLVRIVVVVLVACLVFYLATPTIAQFLLMPVADYLPANEDGQVMLNVLGAFDAFALRFQISIWAALVATAPFILWQVLAFFLPALKPNERKWFVPTFIAGVCLFIGGTVFCYLVILPPAFEWLTDQASGFANILPEASKWVDIIIKFEIGFGLGFELPLVVFYLVIFNVISYEKLRKSWRYVYVGLLIFSAMVTPDASPVTMGLMFAALVLLYEASLLVARIAVRKRRKSQEAKAAIEAKEAEEAREELRDLKARFDDHLWGSDDELAPAKAKRAADTQAPRAAAKETVASNGSAASSAASREPESSTAGSSTTDSASKSRE